MASNIDLISILEDSNNLTLEDVCKLVNKDIDKDIGKGSDKLEYINLLVMLMDARILSNTQQLIAYSILWNQMEQHTINKIGEGVKSSNYGSNNTYDIHDICSIDWFVQRVHDYAHDNYS